MFKDRRTKLDWVADIEMNTSTWNYQTDSVFSFTYVVLVPDSVHSIPLHSPMIEAESLKAICDLTMFTKPIMYTDG